MGQQRLPHAMLFHGPQGTGRHSMVYALAKLINCPHDGPADCTCNVCRKISQGTFADILFVGPQGAAGMITLNGWKPGKDDPDNLQYYRFIDSRPLEGSRKLLVINEADRMNVAMANHLLKMMEEPPSYLTLILVTSRPSALLPTIRSRCASVRFSPLTKEEMLKLLNLAKKDLPPAEATTLLSRCEGRPGRMMELLGLHGEAESNIGRIMTVFQQMGFVALFKTASDLVALGSSMAAENENELETALRFLGNWFRDAMVLKLHGAEKAAGLVVFPAAIKELTAFAQPVSMSNLVIATETVQSFSEYARRQIDRNFVLESLLVKLGKVLRG
jgi:DNA polymerase-3 subunit delta'